jgi:L-histidine Nalpha-methyltransferase
VRVDVYLTPDELEAALRADVRDGLTSSPKELPPKWFYDERGSQLFDEITRLPEYYPTRCERAILVAHAADIAAAAGADTLVELGSGTSEKTRLLLDAMRATGQLRRYGPFDVSEETLLAAGAQLERDYPGLDVHAVVGDFECHLDHIADGGRRMVAFLGGTIGNLPPAERKRFLADLADALRPGETLLLGTDLVKDVERLEAAYDDSAGVTAAFNRNVLAVINRRLHADFDPDAFAHRALYDTDNDWIEMRLVSARKQRVHVADLDLAVDFAADEEMRTEISAKFTAARVEAELADAGLELANWWTDDGGDFGLSLARKLR